MLSLVLLLYEEEKDKRREQFALICICAALIPVLGMIVQTVPRISRKPLATPLFFFPCLLFAFCMV